MKSIETKGDRYRKTPSTHHKTSGKIGRKKPIFLLSSTKYAKQNCRKTKKCLREWAYMCIMFILL